MSSDSDKKPDSTHENRRRSIFGGKLPLERETSWFILVSVLDILMTRFLLKKKEFGEANPVAGFFINRWGDPGMVFFKMGMVAFITVVAQIIATRDQRAARWVLVFGIAAVSGVVVYSLILLLRTNGIL